MDTRRELARLRSLAVQDALSHPLAPRTLVEAALDALLADLDSQMALPSLPVLAGLVRNELGQAADVFRTLVGELGWDEELAEGDVARWEYVRALCTAIVDGDLAPHAGAAALWVEWNELEQPESLTVFVVLADDLDEWAPSFSHSRNQIEQKVVAAAASLLDGPWPPA